MNNNQHTTSIKVIPVPAMTHLPELAAFDAADLGVVAGQLGRHQDPSDAVLRLSSHVYVRSGRSGNCRRGARSTRGVLLHVEEYRKLTCDRTDVVCLPNDLLMAP